MSYADKAERCAQLYQKIREAENTLAYRIGVVQGHGRVITPDNVGVFRDLADAHIALGFAIRRFCDVLEAE